MTTSHTLGVGVCLCRVPSRPISRIGSNIRVSHLRTYLTTAPRSHSLHGPLRNDICCTYSQAPIAENGATHQTLMCNTVASSGAGSNAAERYGNESVCSRFSIDDRAGPTNDWSRSVRLADVKPRDGSPIFRGALHTKINRREQYVIHSSNPSDSDTKNRMQLCRFDWATIFLLIRPILAYRTRNDDDLMFTYEHTSNSVSDRSPIPSSRRCLWPINRVIEFNIQLAA